MIKVAVANKGSLSESSVTLLKEAGYATRQDSRQLVLEDAVNQVQFFYLRPRDIAIYVGSGTLDVGITGLDLLLDSKAPAHQVKELGFARSTFRFATNSNEINSLADLNGKRVATSYPNLLQSYFSQNNVQAQIVQLDGAVESSIELGVADAIADVVSSGTTIKQAGLHIFDQSILESQAILIRSPKFSAEAPELSVLVKRLEGVLTAKEYILLDYDIPTAKLPVASQITPGFEGPTISTLGVQGDAQGWSAVRVMVGRKDMNNIMDQLYEVGARAILATEIIASRL
jgi:ATP phosphoribosyltransferase